MAGNGGFDKLLEPGQIGSVKTRNRIIKTGAGMLMWHKDDTHMNEKMLAFYESMARGGVGLLVVEAPAIEYPRGIRWPERYRIDDDKFIKGLSELVDIIHKHNCPTFMQMNHDGNWQTKLPFVPQPLFEGPPVAPSAVNMIHPGDFHNEMPRELTVTEIEEIIDKYVSAAERARKAGFDGVDINSASSHLGNSFLSPYWNRRTDEYGGSTENRTRFLRTIISEMKKRVGNDFPIAVIINGMEVGLAVGVDQDKLITPAESQKIAQLLAEAGADAIQVRSHWLGLHQGGYLPDALFYPEPPVPVESFPEGYNWHQRGVGVNIPLAEGVKKQVSVPVTVVGRLDPVLGEKILQEGKVDFIGMTRRLIADPELPNKVATGRYDEIAPCTACLNCLGTQRCRINAFLGTGQNKIEKADKKKKVVVIGGGPGGMEAARVAAERGHDVTLLEKAGSLGGLLPLAALVKGTEQEDLPAIIKYYKGQLNKLGVKVELGKEFDVSAVQDMNPDVVIVATGGVPVTPDIPGIDNRKVVSNAKLHKSLKTYMNIFGREMLHRLTKIWMPVGKNVVIIGGGIHGLELAEFLIKRGRNVTIVESSENLGEGMGDVFLMHLTLWFERKGITTMTGVKYEEITDKGLTITTKEGERKTLEADTIIPALPFGPNMELAKMLEGKVPEVYAVGDCKDPLLIADAIGTGSRIAQTI
jgi:2,4-dienoyl-CoA reductase (NADPH2)